MGAVADVKANLEQMVPEKEDTVESFAKKLFCMQIEIYSANAGYDLDRGYDGLKWNNIDSETKKGWYASARKQANRMGKTLLETDLTQSTVA